MAQPLGKTVEQFLKMLNVHSPCNPIIPLEYLSNRNKNTCSHTYFHVDVHSSFIHKSPKWKQGKHPSTSKQIAINPHNGMLFDNKNGNTSNNLGESQNQHDEWKSQTERVWANSYHLPEALAQAKWICSDQSFPVVAWGQEQRVGSVQKASSNPWEVFCYYRLVLPVLELQVNGTN